MRLRPRPGLVNMVKPGLPAMEMRRYQSVNPIVTFGKTAITSQVQVGITITRIIETLRPMAYVLTNPSIIEVSTGIDEREVLASALREAASNQVTSFINVSNFIDVHVYLTISAVAGDSTLTVEAMEQDVPGNEYVTQALWNNLAAVGNSYTVLREFGVGRRFAIRWSVDGTGSVSFAINVVLKKPVVSNNTNTIYIGNSGVTTSSGFGLFPGERFLVTMPENTLMFAIAGSSLPIHILEMGI